jgi:hypothetical protein
VLFLGSTLPHVTHRITLDEKGFIQYDLEDKLLWDPADSFRLIDSFRLMGNRRFST